MGQHVVCVRCEEINISGTFMRNKRTPPHPPAARSPALPVLRPSPPRGSGTVAKARRPWSSGTGTELGGGAAVARTRDPELLWAGVEELGSRRWPLRAA